MTLIPYLIYTLLFTGAVLSVVAKKLTVSGAGLGFVVGVLVYLGDSYTGIILLTLFFVLGSWATGQGLNKKQALGFAEANKGCRTAGQVFANGGVAAITGALAWYFPSSAHTLQLMLAGSLAAATADTISSELGTLLGRSFYNVVTLKKDKPGLDGVISLEGTLAGAGGCVLIALVYGISHGWDKESIWIIIAGLTGNFIDSLLGATLEKKGIIGNNAVNFMNTAAGAFCCLFLVNI
ncbi:MAG: DUF92 domain-containing protein [Mucilaginibacter sp.]